MAHITLRLIWYRLGESFDKMANAGSGITAWLFSDWDDNLLDVLLFGWIGWAALVIVVVNALLTFFGPLKPRDTWDTGTKGVSGAVVPAGTGTESCQWLNSALNWFYLHYDRFPEFVDAWVKALNEQVVKLGGPVQVKFEQVKPGSLPPKFSDVTFEAGPENKYLVKCKVDSKDLSFAVFASQQTAEGVKLTNLTASILKLKGSMRLKCYLAGRDMMAELAFEGRPNVKIVGKPVNPYQDPSDLVDIQVVQEVVRNAICLATTRFNITQWITGDSQNFSHAHEGGGKTPTPSGSVRRTEAVFEPIEAKQSHSAFHAPGLGTSMPRPSRPSPTVEKRLLIKVIKASAVGSKQMGAVDPVCIVFMDTPPQSQTTSVVRSTNNPFWDEQFLFDVNMNTRDIKFEVYDRSKPTGGESFLGEAVVYYEDLKRNPSSRQIIPLQGVMDDGTIASGSITVEFLFLDTSELEAMGVEVNERMASPKRTIEINQAKTPGGTRVITTTTTTQKPLNARYDAHVDESPSYVEKRNVFEYEDSEGASLDRTSPNISIPTQDNSLSSSAEVILVNGGESVAEAAIRELTERRHKTRTPSKTTTLIITGTKRTTESSPTQEIQKEGVPMVTTQPPSPGQDEHREKKKGMSLARQIKKRFSRSKKRSQSAERGGSLKEGSNYLQPPDKHGQPRAKDDLELVRGKQEPSTPNLKKSRSLGGSLKKLFRRGRKQSRSHGETSRESSFSRSSTRNASQGPSREGSLNRTADPQEMQQHRQTLIS